MARVDVEKKRPSRWPWVLGLVIVALAAWGITFLLTPAPDDEAEVQVLTVEDTHPPAAVPMPPNESPPLTGSSRGLAEIQPLGEEDVGQAVRVEGEVVATGNETFWLLTGAEVLRVDSPREVRKGDQLSVAGTLRPADPEKTDRIASSVLSRHPGAERWSVVRVVKLVEEEEEAAET